MLARNQQPLRPARQPCPFQTSETAFLPRPVRDFGTGYGHSHG